MLGSAETTHMLSQMTKIKIQFLRYNAEPALQTLSTPYFELVCNKSNATNLFLSVYLPKSVEM